MRSPKVATPPTTSASGVWPRNAALAVLAASAAFLALKFTGTEPEDKAAPEPATTTAAPSSASTASAAPPSSTPVPAAATGANRPMIPMDDVFPAEVADGSGGTFTEVGAAVLDSCTEADSVGPTLAGYITQSKGCVGEQVALYKDKQNNQFNLAVFTMKDPQDTVRPVTRLSMAFGDYQVAAQAPPPESGLPVLPADSGMVQSFSGYGRAMMVGLGQWSDGRVADMQQLVDRLQPLLQAVSKKVVGYEGTD